MTKVKRYRGSLFCKPPRDWVDADEAEAECRERERKAKLEAWSECFEWLSGMRVMTEADRCFTTAEALRRYGEVVK